MEKKQRIKKNSPVNPNARFILSCTLFLLLILNITTAAQINPTGSVKLATIKFAKKSMRISGNLKNILDSVIFKMKQYDSSSVIEIHGGQGGCFPRGKYSAIEWDRAILVVNYLIKKGWDEHRIVFTFSSETDNNTVEAYKDNNTKRPTEPPAHPVFRKHIDHANKTSVN
jgi:hypothetical protein